MPEPLSKEREQEIREWFATTRTKRGVMYESFRFLLAEIDRLRAELARYKSISGIEELDRTHDELVAARERNRQLREAGDALAMLVERRLASQRLGLTQGVAHEGALNRWRLSLRGRDPACAESTGGERPCR